MTLPPLTHIDLVLLRPFFHSFEVTAFVVRAEIWIWVVVPFDPVHGNQTHISIAHEFLPEEVSTVIYLKKLSV